MFVLLPREFEDLDAPEIFGCYDQQEDARRGAELREGTALAWYDGRLSADYRIVEVQHFSHAEVQRAYRRQISVELLGEDADG